MNEPKKKEIFKKINNKPEFQLSRQKNINSFINKQENAIKFTLKKAIQENNVDRYIDPNHPSFIAHKKRMFNFEEEHDNNIRSYIEKKEENSAFSNHFNKYLDEKEKKQQLKGNDSNELFLKDLTKQYKLKGRVISPLDNKNNLFKASSLIMSNEKIADFLHFSDDKKIYNGEMNYLNNMRILLAKQESKFRSLSVGKKNISNELIKIENNKNFDEEAIFSQIKENYNEVKKLKKMITNKAISSSDSITDIRPRNFNSKVSNNQVRKDSKVYYKLLTNHSIFSNHNKSNTNKNNSKLNRPIIADNANTNETKKISLNNFPKTTTTKHTKGNFESIVITEEHGTKKQKTLDEETFSVLESVDSSTLINTNSAREKKDIPSKKQNSFLMPSGLSKNINNPKEMFNIVINNQALKSSLNIKKQRNTLFIQTPKFQVNFRNDKIKLTNISNRRTSLNYELIASKQDIRTAKINYIYNLINNKVYREAEKHSINYLKEYLPEEYEKIQAKSKYTEKDLIKLFGIIITKIDKFNIAQKYNEFLIKFGHIGPADLDSKLLKQINEKDNEFLTLSKNYMKDTTIKNNNK